MRRNKKEFEKQEIESLKSIIERCTADLAAIQKTLFSGEGDAEWVRHLKKQAADIRKRRSHYQALLEKKTQDSFDFGNE